VRIYTLGTQNRTDAEIAKILSKYQIQVVADIRRSTASSPGHLRREDIQRVCRENKVEYLYLGNELGLDKEQGNLTGLDSELYARGVAILRNLARTRGLLILCSERVPQRCNRRLIAEELGKEGAEVVHLLDLESHWKPAARRTTRKRTKSARQAGKRGAQRPRTQTGRRGKPRKERPPLKKKTARSKMDKAL